ncbi:MAG TPA: hypothetical protein VL133_11125 [Devosia sp.]|nr:hypothetical protein [Devosia sp.]
MSGNTGALGEGLHRLVRLWNEYGAALVSRRLEGALSREFEIHELGGTTYSLRLERDHAVLSEGASKHASHAQIQMSGSDWVQVLSGEWSIIGIVLAGRAPYPKHQRRYLMQLSMLIQTLLLTEAK